MEKTAFEVGFEKKALFKSWSKKLDESMDATDKIQEFETKHNVYLTDAQAEKLLKGKLKFDSKMKH